MYTSGNRFKDNQTYIDEARSLSIKAGLNKFIMYELAYGAEITIVDKEKNLVECVTHVLGCVDTTAFFGTAVEMEYFFKIAEIDNEVSKLAVVHDDDIERILKITNGNPLMIKLGSGIISGSSRTRRILMVLIMLVLDSKGIFSDATSDDLIKEQFELFNKITLREVFEVFIWLALDNEDYNTIIEIIK